MREFKYVQNLQVVSIIWKPHYLPIKSLAFPISLSHTVISKVFFASSLCLISYTNSWNIYLHSYFSKIQKPCVLLVSPLLLQRVPLHESIRNKTMLIHFFYYYCIERGAYSKIPNFSVALSEIVIQIAWQFISIAFSLLKSKITFWIPLRRGVLNTTLCDKACQWLGEG
jgi:hypothetical protein